MCTFANIFPQKSLANLIFAQSVLVLVLLFQSCNKLWIQGIRNLETVSNMVLLVSGDWLERNTSAFKNKTDSRNVLDWTQNLSPTMSNAPGSCKIWPKVTSASDACVKSSSKFYILPLNISS